jgi:hypothetical protein
MGKKNKKDKKAREINYNKTLENDNKLDNELAEVLREIEESTQRVKGTLINKQATQKISSLRAVNGNNNNNELSNNSLLENIKSREAGGKLQTQCTACRRRLFG